MNQNIPIHTQTATGDGPNANPADLFLQEDIPARYYRMPLEELRQRGAEAKKRLGDDLLILCHHYQQDDTFWFSDISGDSLYLARQAAKTKAKYIVFCGVHFMVESADIITSDGQAAILPNLTAGCSMADMADIDSIEDCWDYLSDLVGSEKLLPITYINSTASLKAFCGKHGGTVCTSANAQKILTWAFKQNKKVLFFPDQHLGRNSAKALGVPADQISMWERAKEDGGLKNETIEKASIILWDGYCSVHCRFTPQHISDARARRPDTKVIVHPECPEEIVAMSDYSGSTSQIIQKISESKPGSSWAVGTEINLVNRLAKEHFKKDGKLIDILNPNVCVCSTMYRIHPANVLWVLDQLLDGNIPNQITVPPETKKLAKVAIDRMFELS
ncbi:MAG: quinolinate synthase NadA [Deltaproteobacteria bacterium]|nr:quinolinate synthase NadA [Deltaproteobacteria bacterium]